MKLRNHLLVLHPFLFTLFPIFSLYANNLGEVPFWSVLRALAVGLLACGVALALLRLMIGEWHRAGLAATLAGLLFFTFGRANQFLQESGWLVTAEGQRPLALLAAWGLVFAAGVLWIARRPAPPRGATRLLNALSGIALVTCLYGFAAYGVQTVQAGSIDRKEPTEIPVPRTGRGSPTAGPSISYPDIYYIILDGYTRSDVLSELYGVDNTPFLDYLRGEGFYVASESRSNYAQTALSLASSLNFNYLGAKMELVPELADRGPLHELINDNDLIRFLKAQGYTSVAFSNGFPVTEMTEADQLIKAGEGLNNFEISLLSSSLGGLELDEQIIDSYRQRILDTETELQTLVREPKSVPGPRFVFVHLIVPHPPFIFQRDGSPRQSLDGGDGSHFTGEEADYREGYREQVQFASLLAERMIADILEHSAEPPVILLQGDHGSGMHLEWDSVEESCLRERLSILNAYYLPGRDAEKLLHPGITPVNSFRVVLNAYFNARLPLLPNRSYFSLWEQPYDLQDVSESIEASCAQ